MDDKSKIRDAFERAEAGLHPEIGRLSARVPALVAEARRRRDSVTIDPWAPLVAMARSAVPRLALATGMAVVVAATLHLTTEAPAPTASSGGVERLILTGDDAGTDDPLLQAIAELEAANG
jgi:hypothetical protein